MIFFQYFKFFVFLVCDCMKISSNYVMIILLRMSGQNILLIKAEKTASPIKIP